jgi:formyltetrahydrofolate synthetase
VRHSGLYPNVAVLTTTIRESKTHGGGRRWFGPGRSDEYTKEVFVWSKKGLKTWFIIFRRFDVGDQSRGCINRFPPYDAEIELVGKPPLRPGARCAETRHCCMADTVLWNSPTLFDAAMTAMI